MQSTSKASFAEWLHFTESRCINSNDKRAGIQSNNNSIVVTTVTILYKM